MGAACCKRLDPGSPTASPQLHFCEVVRRCARTVSSICPVDPPQQKPVHRLRKYALSDIVGPVTKKDCCVQTDPLPPPRRRKRKKDRRRSRSLEFLPYLIERESAKTSSGSLECLSGQEDAFNFHRYLMCQLPQSNVPDVQDEISLKKREFLSGLLGEENNNLVENVPETKIEMKLLEEVQLGINSNLEDKKEQLPKPDVESVSLGEANSRRSSITESLKEFESSLMDMLEEDDCSLPQHFKDEDDDRCTEMVRKGPLAILKEENQNEYIITPIEEEPEGYKEEDDEDTDLCFSHVNESHLANSEGFIKDSMKDVDNINVVSNKEKLNGIPLLNQPPKITIEIVS